MRLRLKPMCALLALTVIFAIGTLPRLDALSLFSLAALAAEVAYIGRHAKEYERELDDLFGPGDRMI